MAPLLTQATARGHVNRKQKTITATEAQWREFRQTLDDLRIWQWHMDYPTNGVMDGTQWSLDMAYPDRGLPARGGNNYADDIGNPNGEPKSTNAFNRYLTAVQTLLEARPFDEQQTPDQLM